MVKQLFHGSRDIIERPLFGIGKPYNDYGLGFYCTESIDMAKEWAVAVDRGGFANCYELECEGLAIFDLNQEEFCLLHWLALLLRHREFDATGPLAFEAKEYLLNRFAIDLAPYDAIVGYRADDSYFSFAQDFISGAISYQQLGRAMRLGKLGQQFVLKSERSFDRIRFVGYEEASREEWYERKMSRDRTARREYLDVERNRRKPGELFIATILDEGMGAEDERLR
ncbi:DUF3990 domain-containing protein [Adlercreutzia shanghongiae]|uniref:DUF3990 domain-containing protein n=1 Tax=Adlercreutzia shanghongiae TaxID=3111773 RepID=A0ABU6IYW0_9ACTN|nr:DUF3990 domain-containing protein [Adlercreutzia sp. R22]MEC4294787.1 DUF3990 domain-containing protein [Adlercreutzia sp. R22]